MSCSDQRGLPHCYPLLGECRLVLLPSATWLPMLAPGRPLPQRDPTSRAELWSLLTAGSQGALLPTTRPMVS